MIDTLIIVGSSCVGKTTLIDYLRNSEDKNYDVPLRYVSRPARGKDNMSENQHVTKAKFFKLIDQNLINIWWSREFENNRWEYYGFAPRRDRIAVLSANNAFLRDDKTKELIKHARIILLAAPMEVRQKRILTRSPDLSQEEINHRLKDDASDILHLASAIIDTDRCSPREVYRKVKKELELILGQ